MNNKWERSLSDHTFSLINHLVLVLLVSVVLLLSGLGRLVMVGLLLLGLLVLHTDLLLVVHILLLLLVVAVVLLVVLGRGTSVDLSDQLLVLLGQWHGSGQMIANSAESVLIGDVLDRVLLAIVSLVRVEALGNVGLVLLALVLDLAVLHHLDSVGRLVTELVRGLGLLRLELDNGDVLLLSVVLRLVLVLLLVLLLSLRLVVVLLVRGTGSSHGDRHKGRQDKELCVGEERVVIRKVIRIGIHLWTLTVFMLEDAVLVC